MNDTQPTSTKKPRGGFLLGLLILFAFVALGAFAGYGSGVSARLNAQATQVFASLDEQFALAQEDFAAGRYDVARQRLEGYIIKYDPNFPGAMDLLREVMVAQQLALTPTVTPTPAASPTPDLRGDDAIFSAAQAALAASDWDAVILNLDSLRKNNPSFNTVQVDGLYFVALRNRGVDKILGRAKYADSPNLEGGMYDLRLAERFGPLDNEALSVRNGARQYLIAASYWELNWEQAKLQFAQVPLPYLRDGSGMTTVERLWTATVRYGDSFAAKEDWCGAQTQYQEALLQRVTEELQTKFNDAFAKCNPSSGESSSAAPVVVTPTATGVAPVVETPTETATPTETPSVTP